MNNNIINVAIDGPAGAGKSTVARGAAKQLGYIYVDTGALYRAIGVNALRNGVDTKDKAAVAASLEAGVAASLDGVKVNLVFENGEQKVMLNGEDVSVEIRTPEASMAASDVSAVPEVRAFLFNLQRDIAKRNSCIMDGRDIGTVVLPQAQVKIFLTASPEIRAERRYKELIEKGSEVDYQSVLDDIVKRDYNDSHREIAPLKPAEDSVLFDTTGLALDESVAAITKIIKEKI
ncbi:cytidylate kinase [Clostridium sp. CAG:413]|nr:cytidylate kinase [Clostridium sp. CAG:413]